MQFKRSMAPVALFVTAVAFPVPSLDAQVGSPRITWFTIDAGGGLSASQSGLTLRGSIGQWDAAMSANGGLRLSGGFWSGPRVDALFQDRFEQ